ncbi:MAG: nuclear transport factor 2 family protein [Gemmatimonadota bacterium]
MGIHLRSFAVSWALLASGVGPILAQAPPSERQRVSAVLDMLHRAASRADFDAYFALYARRAIFLGTDATERWTRAEFMDYARARFAGGGGWTYVPRERHVYVADGGRTAWFDERLENENLGETRGSGVLVKEDGQWKVAQYNLSIPIPNALAREVVARIRAAAGGG